MSLLEQALEKYTHTEMRGQKPHDSDAVVSVDTIRRQLLRGRRGELREQAADDWGEIAADIPKLIAFADLLAITQIRESGAIPDTYTATTLCAGCKGEVPIFDGCPPKVEACVWCMNGQTPPSLPGHDK